jgi:integrase
MTKTKGNSNTTVGIYLRCMRTLYNKAIRSGYVNQESYPFGNSKHGKFQIPSSQNVKKALSLKDIEKIFKYHPRSERESFNRDLWIFSYLTNGANISTYTARHSFATILKRSGVPVAYISDALGHADLKTTENYLSGFEDDAMMDIA